MTSDPEELNAALTALVKMLEQWCHIEQDGAGEFWLDSSSYSANAAAMRVLADNGLLSIKTQVGRRVIAKWTGAAREYGADVDFSGLKQPRLHTTRTPTSSKKLS